MLHSFAFLKACTAGCQCQWGRRYSQVLREALPVQGSCGTVSLALLAAGDSLPAVFNRVQVPSRSRVSHLPVVL